jgi:prolyl-tRNA editing enzyme YbaK/EbsC (Cys-tRNA(Pro) deacylase)
MQPMSDASPTGDNSVLEQIRRLLRDAYIPIREFHHSPTHTSEESACARGEELRNGGKALLIKTDDVFRLFVLPADCRADSGVIRRELGVRRTRFASREELLELTGLVPGSVPPFGPPVLPFELNVDEQIRENERIAFNAGSLTDSIVMSVADYLRIARPARVLRFGQRET